MITQFIGRIDAIADEADRRILWLVARLRVLLDVGFVRRAYRATRRLSERLFAPHKTEGDVACAILVALAASYFIIRIIQSLVEAGAHRLAVG